MKDIIITVLENASWPSAVVIIAFLLRKPLQHLTRFRVKDVEIEIGNELQAITKKQSRSKEGE